MIHIFPQQLLPEFEIAGAAQACPYETQPLVNPSCGNIRSAAHAQAIASGAPTFFFL